MKGQREAHKGCNAIIYDTAGRLAIDAQLMDEAEAIKAQVDPGNILLVVDSMIGQDAVRTAAEFNRRLEISGFCLTKLDGDTRRRRDLDQGGHRQTHQVLGHGRNDG